MATVKEHYDKHLGNFYSWMTGNLQEKIAEQEQFFKKADISPVLSKLAIDLGAGNGMHSVALARLGFQVKAIDFNEQLLAELKENTSGLPIEVVPGIITNTDLYYNDEPELILCCGDTIAHLEDFSVLVQFVKDVHEELLSGGKFYLSYRDYGKPLNDTDRFIPVKKDDNRILTCFLEYSTDYVRVTDQLYQKESGVWQQHVSSYRKLRITNEYMLEVLIETGFEITYEEIHNGMYHVVAIKK
ncbi:MAG: methyltransferase domain-containing protein [Ignavibacteriales bacterium]|nr:methyltransferase domain-containing protein [Ignavibacteriales bacterium]